ncbi:MAG: hypothetical protein QNJ69_08205 [Gammaproteobacteria bacterium]|nr:hypothetical protein [Gammaproteobacteria bacterium]
MHPNLSSMLHDLGYQELQFGSVRKAISGLKKHKPEVIVADFLYAYATNYDSNHISNLDSFLISLNKLANHSPKIIFLAEKNELKYVDELAQQYGQYLGEFVALPYQASSIQIRNVLA